MFGDCLRQLVQDNLQFAEQLCVCVTLCTVLLQRPLPKLVCFATAKLVCFVGIGLHTSPLTGQQQRQRQHSSSSTQRQLCCAGSARGCQGNTGGNHSCNNECLSGSHH